jgi:aldose 1-epimerase
MTTTGWAGTLSDGRRVAEHVLTSSTGLILRVMELGAAVRSLDVPGGPGGPVSVVLGHRSVAEYVAPGAAFHGAVVGRYANRIARSRFHLDGVEHRLAANEDDTCLHGGVEGFHTRVWSTVETGEHSVTMQIVSPDGDQGFPGELTATATYAVEDDAVSIDLLATTTAATVVNLANHAYFNLAGAPHGTVDSHVLQLHAEEYLPVDARSIPLGSAEPVMGTPFDFTTPRRLGDRIREPHPQVAQARGVDHAFVLLSGEGTRPAARLELPSQGLAMAVHTDQPSLQVYTGNSLAGTAAGRDGRLLRQGDGIALETQRYPDAPNQGWMPSPVLRPGETYTSTTRWLFTWDSG